MGGCDRCGSKAGCDHRKRAMFAHIEEALARLYPTRTWGEPDDLARCGAGISEREGLALAEELARELDAATFFRAGEDDEYCDYIYILCVGREPCLVQIRDGDVPLPDELRHGTESIDELYLRVCLSQMARMAGVQQVAMQLDIDDRDQTCLVHERPRAGVYDAPLLHRMQRLVALLPAWDITHLDFGEISSSPPGFHAGEYARLYGGAPHTANYLFFPQPATMRITSLLSSGPDPEPTERACESAAKSARALHPGGARVHNPRSSC